MSSKATSKKKKSSSSSRTSKEKAAPKSSINACYTILKETNSASPVIKALDGLAKLIQVPVNESVVEIITSTDKLKLSSTDRLSSTSLRSSVSTVTSDRASVTSKATTASSTTPSSKADSPLAPEDIPKRIIRHVVELKRYISKDINSFQTLEKILFCRAEPNVNIFIQALKNLLDLDLIIAITSLLIKFAIKGDEVLVSNLSFLARKNLPLSLLKCVKCIHDQLPIEEDATLDPQKISKFDDASGNIFSMLVKLAKYEPKLAIMSRLHGSVSQVIGMIEFFRDRPEFLSITVACQVLKTFCLKNDNNLQTLHKSDLLIHIEILLKRALDDPAKPKAEAFIDVVSLFAKSNELKSQILDVFGMKWILNIFSCAQTEQLQKAVLKLLKLLVESDLGKDELVKCHGLRLLKDALEGIIKASEASCGNFSTTLLSLPGLLNSVLRATVSRSDLPFHAKLQQRSYPLPIVGVQEYYGEDLYNGTALLKEEDQKRKQEMLRRLESLCPENLLLLNSEIPEDESLSTKIRVRHVQPMALGQHTACHNTSATELYLQSKKSLALLRRAFFEQTTKIFQNHKGSLVYDVMDDTISRSFHNNDGVLRFDSRFESGNLQFAIKVSQFEYDLVLQSDINTSPGRHNQWFFFSVAKMSLGVQYKFNIINMSKTSSQFNQGMQPCMYSSNEKLWRRTGEGVYYMRNHYLQSTSTSTLTFNITFKQPDIHYIAYHFPYTFSELQRSLYHMYMTVDAYKKHCRKRILCQTLGGNECSLLTITDFDETNLDTHPFSTRKYVLLSARVHPGESNSSHIMNGLLKFLLSEHEVAVNLRRECIFKIVPMLNPDGVINGSHRCSLSGKDLNRQWKLPVEGISPTIYWTKILWQHLLHQPNDVLLSCDFHGHSKKKNVFTYGCENEAGGPFENLEKIFPRIMSKQSDVFDYTTCRFEVEKSKEATSRVVLWHEYGLVNSFTLESSYCGPNQGDQKAYQFSIRDLEQVGVDFCFSVNTLLETPEFSGEKIPRLPSSIISKPIPSEISRRSKVDKLLQDNDGIAKDEDEDANENDDLRELEGPESSESDDDGQ